MWSCKMPTFSGWSLKHSGYANDAEINWINANDVTAENVAELCLMRMESSYQVVLVNVVRKGKSKPSAWKWCSNVGCLLGMQLTCIELARHVLGLKVPILQSLHQKQNTLSLISCDQIDVEDMGEPFAWAFIHLSETWSRQQLLITIKKWFNVVTVNAMSLTMTPVSSLRQQDLSSQEFLQTIVW